MHNTLVRFLTAVVPLKLLRLMFRVYSRTVFWIKYRDSKFPRIVSIEISSHCNRTCAYCPNARYPYAPKLIDPAVMQKVIDRLGEIRYSGVVDFIFFNEPMLNNRLAEYVREVKRQCPGSFTRICTNGDILTRDRVQKLVDAGLERIYVMRHNPTPDGWASNIMELSKLFPGIFVRMDIDEVEGREGLHDFNGLVEVKKHRGRAIVKGKARCQVHRHVAQITIDGDWNLCCVDYAKTLSFGSLIKHSMLDIWRSEEFTTARRHLENGVAVTKTCSTCTCLVERQPTWKRPDYVVRPETKLPADIEAWAPTK